VNGARNVNGGAQEVIRIGSVPTRALNLPDEFMYDSYGSRFLYAVSADLATTAYNFEHIKSWRNSVRRPNSL